MSRKLSRSVSFSVPIYYFVIVTYGTEYRLTRKQESCGGLKKLLLSKRSSKDKVAAKKHQTETNKQPTGSLERFNSDSFDFYRFPISKDVEYNFIKKLA